MNCAACSGTMQEEALDGVQIDRCTSCQGVWLDKGEAEELFKTRRSPREELQKKKLDRLREWAVPSLAPVEVERTCPRCKKALVRLNYKDLPGLEVEACRHNSCGMYLDQGELEKVRLLE